MFAILTVIVPLHAGVNLKHRHLKGMATQVTGWTEHVILTVGLFPMLLKLHLGVFDTLVPLICWSYIPATICKPLSLSHSEQRMPSSCCDCTKKCTKDPARPLCNRASDGVTCRGLKCLKCRVTGGKVDTY